MKTAEIVEGLRSILSDFRNDQFTDGEFQSLNAAIAALEPVPITEDRLREVGFVGDGTHRLYMLPLAGNHCFACLRFTPYSGMAVELMDGDCYDLHITSMQQLAAVIEALGGEVQA